MTVDTIPESRQLNRICRQLERDGYDVIREPSTDDLPKGLQPFRPDAIAFREDGNLVVEVKTFGGRSGDQLRRLRRAVDALPGWGLLVSFADPPIPPEPLPSIDELQQQLSGVRELAERSAAAALMVAWSVLEAGSRRYLSAIGERRDQAQESVALVADLISFGLADPRDESSLCDLASLRNRIAHGYPGAAVPAHQLIRLQSIAEAVLTDAAVAEAAPEAD